MGLWVACDYMGVVRIVFGSDAGSLNDVNLYRRSGMEDELDDYLDEDGQILFDGIYYFMGHPFVTPYTTHHNHILTDYEKEWNKEQRKARIIIENVFGHTKSRFGIISNKYSLKRKTLSKVARCAFLLNNIIILNQAPLRKYYQY